MLLWSNCFKGFLLMTQNETQMNVVGPKIQAQYKYKYKYKCECKYKYKNRYVHERSHQVVGIAVQKLANDFLKVLVQGARFFTDWNILQNL